MKHFIVVLAAAAGLAVSSEASAATYVASRAVGAGTLDLSITTDNTIGVLQSGNIASYSITVTDADGSFTLDPTNSEVGISGTNFTATATSLLYDFAASGTNFAAFQRSFVGSGYSFYCLQTMSCFDSDGPAEALDSIGSLYGNVDRSARTGLFAVASIQSTAAVPEPATWAMMIGGFGAVGSALRRRRPVRIALA